MQRNVYKVQIRLTDDDDNDIWRDFHLDMSLIYSWYLPDLNEDLGPAIIVFTPGDSFYIKAENKVKTYLAKNLLGK